jgi:hypothetical protein
LIKIITRFVFTFFILIALVSTAFSQSDNLFVIDSFGDHNLPGWYSGGNLSMKYSHSQDNLENGYGIVSSGATQITPNSFAGLIKKEQKIQLAENNILSLKLQGHITDMNLSVQLLYDSNNEGKYDEAQDKRIEKSSPFCFDITFNSLCVTLK